MLRDQVGAREKLLWEIRGKGARRDITLILNFFTFLGKTDIILSGCTLTLHCHSPSVQFLPARSHIPSASKVHCSFACCSKQFALALLHFWPALIYLLWKVIQEKSGKLLHCALNQQFCCAVQTDTDNC